MTEEKDNLDKLIDYINRSLGVDDEETELDRDNTKNFQIYLTTGSNSEVKQHDTEIFSFDLPWDIKRLVKDGILNIRNYQFTVYHGSEYSDVRGYREYNLFIMCSVDHDRLEKQDWHYFRANVTYP